MRKPLPIIGIPLARQKESSSGYVKQQVGDPYLRAIEEAGGCPVMLPVTQNPDLIECMLSLVHGVFLTGGGDIDPQLYGESPSVVMDVDHVNDEFEIAVCRHCVDEEVPLLAVCRGAQVLNVALGGTLIQDIPTELNTPVPHRQSASRQECTHGIRIDTESRLREILRETEFRVNSFHHQAIDRLGSRLKAVAYSEEDGIIEGIEIPGEPFAIGVQFHPEEICHCDGPTIHLFRALIQAASQRQNRGTRSE